MTSLSEFWRDHHPETMSVPTSFGITLASAARTYADAGFVVVPTDPQTKHPGSILGNDWPSQATNNVDMAKLWWREHPNAGIGLVTGLSGVLAFDIDLDVLPPELSFLQNAAVHLTRPGESQRGHYIYRTDEVFTSSRIKVDGRVVGEIRSGNTIIVVSPTPHSKGGLYQWMTTGEIPRLPDQARHFLTPDPTKAGVSMSVADFLDNYTADDQWSLLAMVASSFRRLIDQGENVHSAMHSKLCLAFKESAAKLYPARAAETVLRQEWLDAIAGSSTHDEREFDAMLPYAVEAALSDDHAKRRKIARRDFDTDTRTTDAQWSAFEARRTNSTGSETEDDDDPFGSDSDDDVPDELEAKIERGVADALVREEVKSRVAEQLATKRIEINADRATSALSFLNATVDVEPLWGKGARSLWSPGEGLMIVGPQGTGKSTIAQQLCLARMKATEPVLLGYPVATDDRPILYLAMDRPAQIRRSLARMVNQTDERTRDRLDHQMIIWQGPPPLKANEAPEAFCEWVRRRGHDPGLVVVDSLKDLLSGLIDDRDGSGFNNAMQLVLAELDCQFVTLHHQRKATSDNRKPDKISDVYGSGFLTAGQGSVVLLWGEPGSGAIEFNHLKQPQEKVEPFLIHHEHAAGASSAIDIEGEVIAYAMLHSARHFTMKEVGAQVFAKAVDDALSQAESSKLKRVLSKLSGGDRPKLEHTPGKRGGNGGGGSEAKWMLRLR